MAGIDFSDPQIQQTLLKGGLDMLGGTLSGYGQAQISQANRDLSLQELIMQLQRQAANQGLQGTQLNPATQANDLFSALARGNMASNLRPSQVNAPSYLQGFVPQLSGGAMGLVGPNGLPQSTLQALSPQAILASANQFQQNQAAVNPDVPTLDLSATFGNPGKAATLQNEAFRTQEGQKQAAQQQALLQSLQSQNQSQNDSGSGFWHKFAKIAGIAGAGLATALTAGGASPLLAAAIGAGSGAAGGWGSGGGLKGTLLGAAGGAIPGAIGGIASKLSPLNGTLARIGASEGMNALGNARTGGQDLSPQTPSFTGWAPPPLPPGVSQQGQGDFGSLPGLPPLPRYMTPGRVGNGPALNANS